MKKLLFGAIPLFLMLTACGSTEEEGTGKVEETENVQPDEKTMSTEVTANAEREWIVDERLQEPTEDTICEMCNMKVYMKDDKMGVFSAQAVKADGSIAFYDDIGCLLNAEFAHEEVNEKFVRDYHTLNWFNVDDAYIVKTALKSPMNWGYIFFKYEEDATTYVTENEGAKLTPLHDIRKEALERRKKKMAQREAEQGENSHHEEQHEEGHGHGM
ncbi:hypothetical protein BLL40_09450 [Domibacillus mangrovi]|uniref:Lipoprotein n=2 Tax=Domibacillus mangrovi TaxID=1714354 RepID=A0A1Q5P451_9BACI|nr:hypothetical protein BLL40_09450 [Domibacillus mangrovi]